MCAGTLGSEWEISSLGLEETVSCLTTVLGTELGTSTPLSHLFMLSAGFLFNRLEN